MLVKQLASELAETVDLITDRLGTVELGSRSLGDPGMDNSSSLLDSCDKVLARSGATLHPPVRTLHHFASTGGTLFAKLIASLPNTFLLSEVHPHSSRVNADNKFAPSDLAVLSAAAKIPDHQGLAEKLYLQQIMGVSEWLVQRGGVLVLRDHSHSDFCVRDASMTSSTFRILEAANVDVWPLCTVRHPADSFASSVTSGFFYPDFDASNPVVLFDWYCQSYLKFLDDLPYLAVLRYEDLVEDPATMISRLGAVWDIEVSDFAPEIFSLFGFSGDSGRRSNQISIRQPRPLAVDLRNSDLRSYQQLIDRLGYS